MASETIVNLDLLLESIPGDNPAGQDIRQDPSPVSPYQSIKAARNAARAAERNSIHDGNSNEAEEHWKTILQIAPEILGSQAKDLEIASWYSEALLRLYGFRGLRDGFTIIHGFIEKFWDNLYPMPDEDGIETRVACLSGLNGEGAEGVLIAPIRKAEITEGNSVGPFTLWEYQQALDVQKIPDDKARKAKREKVGFDVDTINKAVTETNAQFFIDLRDDLEQAIDLYRRAGQMLDEYCGTYDAPPTRTIIESLEECLGVIKHIARDKFPLEVDTPEADTETADENAESAETGTPATVATPSVTVTQAAMMNRELAFKQLKEIAEFFRKTEPHSPVSYLLDKAVRWGDMPLTALIQELIPDSSSRSHFSELTGVMADDE